MQYAYSDLGQRKRGDVVEVTLHGNQANVVLLDSSNYSAFRSGRQYRYSGGLATSSPVRLAVPNAGHWYAVAFIPEGYNGQARANFRVLGGALPPIRPATTSPLRSIREAADEYAESVGIEPADKEYDVFISHAGEDKAESSVPWPKPCASAA